MRARGKIKISLVNKTDSCYFKSAMTDKAYEAFEIFRDLGPSRTLTQVAEITGKHIQQLYKWSSKYKWMRLCVEYDNKDLKKKLGERESIRETALQTIIDRMHTAIDKVFSVMTDDRQLPVFDRQGEQVIGPDGKPCYKPLVKASTQLQAAQMILGIGGLVAVKRTEVVNKTAEDIDRAAGIMSTMTPDQLRRLVADLKNNGETGVESN